MKIHRDNMKQPHFHKLFLDVSCVPRPFTIQIKVNRLKTDSTWSDQISSKRTSKNKESCHDKSSIHSYPQFKKHLSWDVMGTSVGVNCIRHSSRLLPSFLDGRMAWHFQINASFILSQLWHWLPSKQKYVTDCCIAAIFRVAFLSFLFSIKDSLWLLPFLSSSHLPLTLARFQFAGSCHAEQNMLKPCKVCWKPCTLRHQIQQDIYANSVTVYLFINMCFCVETTRSTFQLRMRQTFGFPIPSATEQCMLCQSVATRQGQPKDLFAWIAYLLPSNGLCPNVATHEIKATFGIGIYVSARQRSRIACLCMCVCVCA